MIKLVACDLDGTLFNSDMVVSPENAAAIRAAQESGIEFLVATGRAPKQSKFLLKDAGIKTGFINLNGALVYDTNDHLTVKNPIADDKALKIIKLLHDNGFYFEIVTKDNIYSENLNTRVANVAHILVDLNPSMTFKDAVVVSAGSSAIMNTTQVQHFSDLFKTKDHDEIMKIIAFDQRGHEAFADVIQELNKMGGLAVSSSSSSNIEINDEKAQKGIALLEYAKKRGIKPAEIAAIGDNLNDKSMIEKAGVGVAMGNAIPLIKKLAQLQTLTNNENGVAHVLKIFIENNRKQSR